MPQSKALLAYHLCKRLGFGAKELAASGARRLLHGTARQPCGITKTSGMSALFQSGRLATVTVERRTISRLD